MFLHVKTLLNTIFLLTKYTFALVAVWGDSLKEDKVIVSIMGPSGSGKTTLTDNLILNHDIIVPRHVTTREASK